MTAWFSSQLLFLRCQQCPGALCITSRHSPATPRDRCNRDGHTTGWDAQKGNILAPPGHTASKRSWTPVPHTSVTILCYHWSSLGPHRGQLLCLADPRFPRGSLHSSCGPRPLPPPPSCYQSQRGPSRPSPPPPPTCAIQATILNQGMGYLADFTGLPFPLVNVGGGGLERGVAGAPLDPTPVTKKVSPAASNGNPAPVTPMSL